VPRRSPNKHGFLAGALNAAVAANHIPANPCTGMGMGMPKNDDPREAIFLTREEYALLHSMVTPFWQPMVEFLVASGARWGEAAALRPGDVEKEAGTVRISQSWKQGADGYRLGSTKTKKGVRTINVPKSVLDKLDFSNEFLFVNRAGGPVRAQGFFARVCTCLETGMAVRRWGGRAGGGRVKGPPAPQLRSPPYLRVMDDPGRCPATRHPAAPRS
jgi:integrase